MKSSDVLREAVAKGYSVDNDGNVWFNNKVRKLILNSTGYFEIAIRCKGEKNPKPVPVHRLQAYQKFGEKIFEPCIVVRHLDGNPQNNTYENIEIGTHQDNMMDIPKEKRIAHAKLAASYQIKYDADEIKKYHTEVKSYAKTMKKFNITSKGTLNYILRKR